MIRLPIIGRRAASLAAVFACALAPQAHAQTAGSLVLYGRLHAGVDNYAASGATNGSTLKPRNRVFDQNSRLGVRGSEDLGGGLRAIVQIETGLNVDNGGNIGQAGLPNVSTGFGASRDSFVGIEGGFGRLTLGRQSVWWLNGTILPFAAQYIHAEMPWVTGQGGRISMGIIRNSDTMQYNSPTIGGANLTASWSPNTTTGGGAFVNNESRQAGQDTGARLFGLTARWAGGPFALQLDYGDKITAADAVPDRRPRNVGWKLLAGWRYAPGSQIAAIGTRIENRASNPIAGVASAGDDLRQHAFGLSWEQALPGSLLLLAQIGRQQRLAGCTLPGGCDATGSRSWMVGVRHAMSRRTAVYATYNATRNEANQTADYVSSSISSASPLPAGADPRIFGVGLVHSF